MKELLYKLKSGIVGWFGDIKVYKYPMFILCGHTSYKIKGHHVREIIDILKPGDILLRRYDHYLSGLMIPGYFTHGSIFVGDDQIIHLLGDGICKEDPLVFTRCDDIVIIRCTDETLVKEAIKRAHEQFEKDVEYDFDFETDKADRFYCTEFIAYCFVYPRMRRIREGLILPDDFLTAPTYGPYKIIWRKK